MMVSAYLSCQVRIRFSGDIIRNNRRDLASREMSNDVFMMIVGSQNILPCGLYTIDPEVILYMLSFSAET